MEPHKVVSREEWIAARKAHLVHEKEFTRQRDALSRQRRELPWVRVTRDYVFEGAAGKKSLAGLFAGKSQLIVYHFMFHPKWTEGCKSCSFWADNYDRIVVHLNHRDANLVGISRAPYETFAPYKKRMGWTFEWLSSADNDFNYDFAVSFKPETLKSGALNYNFGLQRFGMEEAPGTSVFFKNDKGEIFHTYSTYARGLDMLNGAYHLMDILPKGRDEEGLSYGMEWPRRRDQYEG